MVAGLHQLASAGKFVGAVVESACHPRLPSSGKVSQGVHPVSQPFNRVTFRVALFCYGENVA